MANEMELRVGQKRLRCDSVLFNRDGQPQMIIEYKAPDIPITESVFNQIMAYNTQLGVHYLVMSNGLQHIIIHLDLNQRKWIYLPHIPRYDELL